jgi:uncharacterized protein DUF2530
VSRPPEHADEHFRPLRPATGLRWIAAVILGPMVWLIAFLVTGLVFEQTDAIEGALIVTASGSAVGLVVLLVLRWARDRERRRYERG